MKKRVFSIVFLMLLSFFISSATIKAAPPEGFDFNNVLNLIWTDQEAISQDGEFHLVTDEIDGMPYTIPMLANWLLTADMGDVIGAFNDVGAIYPGHSEAYTYYIFMLDIEELHFYNYKLQLKKTVPFDELVSVTTEHPFIGDDTLYFEFKVDGETYASSVVQKGDQLEAPADPVKENHVFDGWYKDSQFNYLYDFNDIVVNGFNLYAKFIPGPVNIKFYNGELLHADINGLYGEKLISLPLKPFAYDYYRTIYSTSFSNHNTQLTPNENILVTEEDFEWEFVLSDDGYPKYINSFFTINGKTPIITKKPLINIKNITITGYSNIHDPSVISVYISSNKIDWTLVESKSFPSKMSYKNMYDINENGPIYIKIEHGFIGNTSLYSFETTTNIELETGLKYTFDKWYYNQELTQPYNMDDILTTDINLYAAYVEKQYELFFDSNGGSSIISQSYYEDDLIILPEYNPSRIGYVFVGWYLDEELEQEFNIETMPGEDVILYAKWEETEELQYLIEFYLGEELYTYITLQEEQQLILPTAPPAEENQIFLGWYYDGEFTQPFKVTDPIDDDIALYGHFGTGGGGTMPPPEEPTTPGSGFTFKKEYIIYIVLGVLAIGLITFYLKGNKKTTKKRK